MTSNKQTRVHGSWTLACLAASTCLAKNLARAVFRNFGVWIAACTVSMVTALAVRAEWAVALAVAEKGEIWHSR
jgi:hypothetical protein